MTNPASRSRRRDRAAGSSVGKNGSPQLKFPSSEALAETQSIQDVRARAKAAVLGAFVADAACMGLHWVPTADTVASILTERNMQCRPEFLDPPACQQYQYATGSLSPLGDELLPLLQSLTTHGGFFGPHFLQTCHTAYSAYKGYHTALAIGIRQALASGEQWPFAACNDCSVQCLLKMPIMAGRYGGKRELQDKAQDAVRAHQDHADARLLSLAYVRMLERVLLGQSVAEVLVWASTDDCLDRQSQQIVQRALWLQNAPHAVAVKGADVGSQASACFFGALHAAATSATFADSVRNSGLVGGETCGRAQLVGALFAAQDGLNCIPLDWQRRVARFQELEGLVDQLVAQRAIIELI